MLTIHTVSQQTQLSPCFVFKLHSSLTLRISVVRVSYPNLVCFPFCASPTCIHVHVHVHACSTFESCNSTCTRFGAMHIHCTCMYMYMYMYTCAVYIHIHTYNVHVHDMVGLVSWRAYKSDMLVHAIQCTLPCIHVHVHKHN